MSNYDVWLAYNQGIFTEHEAREKLSIMTMGDDYDPDSIGSFLNGPAPRPF